MKITSLFIVLFFLFTSCTYFENDIVNKDCPTSCTIIMGKITTGNGSLPIKKLSLSLEWNSSVWLVGATIRKKAITLTDAQGFYKLEFLVRDDELMEGYYTIEAEFDNDIYLNLNKENNLFSFYKLKQDTVIEANYWLPKKAFLDLKLSNIEDIKPGDTFYSNMYNKLGVNNAQTYGHFVNWINHPTGLVIEVAAEQPLFIEHSKLKNNVRIIEHDTLQLKAQEKITYTPRF